MTDDEQVFPCAVCGADHADWDDNVQELRCPEHHAGGREIDFPERVGGGDA